MPSFPGSGHGHPNGYKKGCDQCKQAARELRERRQKRTGVTRPVPERAPVVMLPGRPAAVGAVEQATIDECAPFLADRPAMVSQAVTLARIMDDPQLFAIFPATSKQLTAILNSLHGARKPKSRGRLAAVQQLTRVK